MRDAGLRSHFHPSELPGQLESADVRGRPVRGMVRHVVLDHIVEVAGEVLAGGHRLEREADLRAAAVEKIRLVRVCLVREERLLARKGRDLEVRHAPARPQTDPLAIAHIRVAPVLVAVLEAGPEVELQRRELGRGEAEVERGTLLGAELALAAERS